MNKKEGLYNRSSNRMTTTRQQDIDRFYNLLDEVVKKFPERSLDKIPLSKLPENGVYFFFEPGETRHNSNVDRVVRIGTHAAIDKSKATLYQRLYAHKGSKDLRGNHRGSVFRQLIGYSLIYKDSLRFRHWGDKSKKNDKLVKLSENDLERSVSSYLYSLKFTVLEVPGPSSKYNDRAIIEENTIALLSNYNRQEIDKCSKNWLGLYSNNNKVIGSGLWNSKCVDREEIDANYFDIFEKHLTEMSTY